MKISTCLALGLVATVLHAADTDLKSLVAAKVDAEYPSLLSLYTDLHRHPELSLMEEKTSQKVAAELRAAGFEVTERFGGGYALVGVLHNGPGPTLLIRTDLDALPVKEETGLPYASTDKVKDLAGREVSVMHACGHDVHMTVFTGTARVLSSLRDHWSGTLLFLGQPAEEVGTGARVVLAGGLYRKFPVPNFALALHDSATLPAGTIGLATGYAWANVDTVEIVVRGIGGHGAYPHATKDPVVLAARIVVALQTIVSREIRPIEPAVVTVGSIHGGTKANVIPNEVTLQLTLRSYTSAVRAQIVEAVRRICRGEAIAAGIPDDLMPVVTVSKDDTSNSQYNDPALSERVRAVVTDWLGADRMVAIAPEMGGEDFSEYARTPEHVPECMFRVGAVDPARVAESERTGVPLPSLHSSRFAPVPEPTLRAGVTAMSAVALNILRK